MNQSQYDLIKTKFGQFSSWAIWNDTGTNQVETPSIENSIDRLHSKFVIIGFNASRNLSGNWMNFHMPHQGGRDIWLAEIFNKEPFIGAYMTDLIKIAENGTSIDISKAASVERQFFQPSKLNELYNSKMQKQSFKEEMELIGANEKTIFILIGELVSRYFDCFTDFKYPNKKNIPHYAGRFTKQEWIEKCMYVLQ